MKHKELKTVRLSWDFVGACIEKEIKKLIGLDMKCKASASEWDYWAVSFLEREMELSKLYPLFEKVGLIKIEAQQESLPEEGKMVVRSIGMQLSEAILQKHLGYSWTQILAGEYLWLIGVDSKCFFYCARLKYVNEYVTVYDCAKRTGKQFRHTFHSAHIFVVAVYVARAFSRQTTQLTQATEKFEQTSK